MGIHRKDRQANNPRLQCSCCGQWKRLSGYDADGKMFYRFYGGCGYTNGDHLAAKPGSNTNDVCDDCCQIECRRLFECKEVA